MLSSCKKLQKIAFVASSPGDPWFLGPLFSVYLPNSIRSISLRFYDVNTFSAIFSVNSKRIKTFWEEFDNALTSPRFPNLTLVVIKWHFRNLRHPTTPNGDFIRHLDRLHEMNTFKEFFPKLYKSDILWCGLGGSDIVYHVSESAFGSGGLEGPKLLSCSHPRL